MSLRTKLVLALVLCTTVTSAVVGALSYRSTQQRLVAEVDASLESTARVLANELERRGPGAVGRSLAAVGEVEVQIIDADGQARSRAGVDGIPVSSADVGVAEAASAGVQLLRTDVWDDSAVTGGRDSSDSGDRRPGAAVLEGEPDIDDGESIRLLTESFGASRGAVQVARSLEETERVLDSCGAGSSC